MIVTTGDLMDDVNIHTIYGCCTCNQTHTRYESAERCCQKPVAILFLCGNCKEIMSTLNDSSQHVCDQAQINFNNRVKTLLEV